MKFFFKLITSLCLSLSVGNMNLYSQIKINEGFEGAEFPPAGWSVFSTNSSNGQWAKATRITSLGMGCAVSNFSSINSSNYLITKRFIPSAGDSIVFSFKQTFWNVYKDTLNIRISNTDSTFSGANTLLLNLREGFNYPSPNGFKRYAVSLNAFAGQNVWVAFQHSDQDGDYLRLDEIKVGNLILAEVGVIDNIFPEGLWGNCSFSQFFPKATIKNFGSANISTPFNTTYKITGPVSYTSVRSDTLGAGYSKTLNFDSLAYINVPGTYSVKIYTSLEGDLNPLNDTLTSSFTIFPSNYGGGTPTYGDYFFANSSSCAAAYPQPQFCWRDTTSSVSLISNRILNSGIPFIGTIDNGYFKLGNILPAGKKIKFFNIEYDSIFITTNGILGFKNNSILTSNNPANVFLLMSQPVPAFAALWLDIDYQNANVPVNRLSYKVTQNQLIITYDNAPLKNGGSQDYVSFQISFEIGNSLPLNSNIVTQYNESNTGTSFINKYYANTLPAHLIGIKNINGSKTLTYRFRDTSKVITGGILFNGPLALQIGPELNELTSRYFDLNFKVLLEAISPFRDTVTVSIAETVSPYSVIESKKIFINSDGTGNGKFSLPDNVNHYYLIFQHRNSISTWSRLNGEMFNNYTLNFDLSADASMAYGGNLKTIGSYAYLYTGDVNQDGILDGSDLSLVENNASLSLSGYYPTDINGDGITDVTDLSFLDNNANLNLSVIHP